MIGRAALAFVVAATTSCARPTPEAGVRLVRLGGAVARIGSSSIPVTTVRQVAASVGEAPNLALDSLVADALLAEGAQARSIDREPAVRWACAAALARRVLQDEGVQARALGPASDDELATITVIHAVVRRSRNLDDARGWAVADGIARAVADARSEDEFRTRTNAAPHSGLLLTIERVGPFDASGRGSEGERFEPRFVAAAFALHAVGETSPVVATQFGWHVIRLLERRPPDPTAVESLRADLSDAVIELRARIRVTSVLAAQRARTPVTVYGTLDQLLAVAGGP